MVQAHNLRVRGELIMQIDEHYRRTGMSIAKAARAWGIPQRTLNALQNRRISQLSIEALVKIAIRAGLNVRLVVKKAA
jgi:predicted XRE-type DNA-binding protein